MKIKMRGSHLLTLFSDFQNNNHETSLLPFRLDTLFFAP